MSYCVNCGVKLAESEKICPLCHCPVVNPMELQQPNDVTMKEESPYPKRRDTLKNIVDRSFVVSVASILYIIPLLVCLLVDWMLDGVFAWSVIATVGICLSWAVFFLPVLFDKKYLALYTAVDLGLLIALFFTIGWYTGDYSWIGVLAIPLATILYGITNVLSYLRMAGVLRRKLYLSATILGIIGLLCILVEWLEWVFETAVLHQYKQFEFWSVIVFISCFVIAGVLCYIEKKKKLKKSLEKNLHI